MVFFTTHCHSALYRRSAKHPTCGSLCVATSGAVHECTWQACVLEYLAGEMLMCLIAAQLTLAT
eukprot:1159972-Pelagomonas_calceolata.AAC.13